MRLLAGFFEMVFILWGFRQDMGWGRMRDREEAAAKFRVSHRGVTTTPAPTRQKENVDQLKPVWNNFSRLIIWLQYGSVAIHCELPKQPYPPPPPSSSSSTDLEL